MSERLPWALDDDDDGGDVELARIEEEREALRVQKEKFRTQKDPPLPTNPRVEWV